ncbi:hypothetical protein HJFPF1_12477 [Paramyrothecium foliicola]|nr:hypothetical protein HJFPF1_12477 [Paramyrothecium foliicola]
MSGTNLVVNHSLRRAILVSFLVALPLNIVAAALHNMPLPAVGLIPLGLSNILSGLLLGLSRLHNSEESNKKRGRTVALVTFINDVLAIIGLLVVLILTWNRYNCSGWGYCYSSDGDIFLIAYATVPMLASLFFHTYLALVMLYHSLGVPLIWNKPSECPHCHEAIQPSYAPHFSFARGAYEPSPVREEDRFRDDEGEVTLLDPAGDLADSQQATTSKHNHPEVA